MKKHIQMLLTVIAAQLPGLAIAQASGTSLLPELFFVSDTQQPMWMEKILLRPHNNLKATAGVFASIAAKKPTHLFMLGDVVSLGFAGKKWGKVDSFLDTCRRGGVTVCGLLGNHDVMLKSRKGEDNFQKRFPMHVRTGYVTVADSVAVVMLNSNFTILTEAEKNIQQTWYNKTLAELDSTATIKAIIVCCHHAPFSNSKMVGCCKKVQDNFVPEYIAAKKAKLFITGHSHAFEHFKIKGKDFLVIGGGGGLNQPLRNTNPGLQDLALDYKPNFHYLSVKRRGTNLVVISHFLKKDFTGFEAGMSFTAGTTAENMAKKEAPEAAGNNKL